MMLGVKVGEGATEPKYATEDSAAFDMAIPEDITVAPRGYLNVQLNLVFAIPHRCVLYVRPRNSTFQRYGLIFVGSGIIDEDYRGPKDVVGFPVYNPSDEFINIPKGTRIAQGMVMQVEKVAFYHYEPDAPNRGGTGSTGV